MIAPGVLCKCGSAWVTRRAAPNHGGALAVCPRCDLGAADPAQTNPRWNRDTFGEVAKS